MTSSFVVPALLLALTAFVAHLSGPLPDELTSFLRVYPWLVLAAGVLLGLRFRRGRVVFAVVAIALADRMLLRFAPGAAGAESARWAFNATAFLLPLDLAWLCLARERGTLTPNGFLRACVIAAQPAAVSFTWLSYHPRLVALLDRRVLPPGVAPALVVPHLALAAFAASFLAVGVLCVRRRKALEVGFLWAIVGCFIALEWGHPATLFLATSGLIVVVALLESTFAMAFRDPLTSLPGRRAFDETVEKLAGAYTLAVVDVDRFKEVNDRHGHDVGDQVLRMVATRLAAAGGGARAFRIGGEEFALVFPNRSPEEAERELESVRGGIEESRFALRGPGRPARKPKTPVPRAGPTPQIGVTVSIGFAAPGGRLTDPSRVLRAADAALYRAKRAGRNCVRGSGESRVRSRE
ncbi:MAG TPA: GGDEF domain-containing protein [Thermoanaerobaculaceae bacterium]|nr:GGDEF domain-containing protein [Thermoanaerobaculaceae bacterium]